MVSAARLQVADDPIVPSGIAVPSGSDAGKPISSASMHGGSASLILVKPSSTSDAAAASASWSDQHLVLAAKSGCRTAFDELWNLYSRRVYRTVFKITKNAQDAEDAVQDSFLHAFLACDSFEGRSSFYSWLTRIAINSALGILRKRRCRPEIPLNPTHQADDETVLGDFRDSAPSPEQSYDQSERRTKLKRAIHKLPANLRAAIQTHITEECSIREVARKLNISEAAAKTRLHRARKQLGSLSGPRNIPKTSDAVNSRFEPSLG